MSLHQKSNYLDSGLLSKIFKELNLPKWFTFILYLLLFVGVPFWLLWKVYKYFFPSDVVSGNSDSNDNLTDALLRGVKSVKNSIDKSRLRNGPEYYQQIANSLYNELNSYLPYITPPKIMELFKIGSTYGRLNTTELSQVFVEYGVRDFTTFKIPSNQPHNLIQGLKRKLSKSDYDSLKDFYTFSDLFNKY